MGRELTHEEASELLGVYALDALDVDEREAVDRHLGGCRMCQVEVVEHREVAAVLTAGLDRPPEGLWERISASLEDVPPPLAAPPPPPGPAPATPPRPGAAPAGRQVVVPIGSAPSRRGAGLRVAAMVAATAAVAVIGILGFKVVDDSRRIDQIAVGVHGDELERTIGAAMANPTATKVALTSEDKALFADAWVLPDGHGYIAADNLPELAPGRGYQLWALTGDTPVSIGLLGPDPRQSAFRAAGPLRGLAITNEPAVGVSTPSQDPLVLGLVSKS
jgi:hypothetical protein